MADMKVKALWIILFLSMFVGCTSSNTPLPTLIPTAFVEATATTLPGLPATNTPLAPTEVDNQGEAVLQAVDRETCQEVVETQQELEELQAEGEDVAELATAVAELITELDNCVILLTPTPLNQ